MAKKSDIEHYMDMKFSDWPTDLQSYFNGFSSSDRSSMDGLATIIGSWLDVYRSAPKGKAGRPRKERGTLAHDTRDRHFHQIEESPLFESAIHQIRVMLAKQRSTPQRTLTYQQISISAAVRHATIEFAREHLKTNEVFPDLKVPPSS